MLRPRFLKKRMRLCTEELMRLLVYYQEKDFESANS